MNKLLHKYFLTKNHPLYDWHICTLIQVFMDSDDPETIIKKRIWWKYNLIELNEKNILNIYAYHNDYLLKK